MADSIVAGWLVELGLNECISLFREEGIDSEALASLDESQLMILGVKRMGDRTKVQPIMPLLPSIRVCPNQMSWFEKKSQDIPLAFFIITIRRNSQASWQGTLGLTRCLSLQLKAKAMGLNLAKLSPEKDIATVLQARRYSCPS
jgi:hypothetical protein